MKKLTISLILLAILLSGIVFVRYFLPINLPTLPYSLVLQDRTGKEIGEIVYSGSIRHRAMQFEEIPEFYRNSLLAVEDRRFYSHPGIDPIGLGRSLWNDLKAGRFVEWWSTIEAQLVRNVLWINEGRSIGRKLLEFLYALRIDGMYTKNEILTMYCDRIAFGYLNYGLKSAVRYYFNREPKDLTHAEQIAMIVIPKDAQKYDPYLHPKAFRTRFELIVQVLANRKIISEEEVRSILSEKLIFNTNHRNELPYVADAMKKEIRLTSDPSPSGERVANTVPLLLTKEKGLGDEAKNNDSRGTLSTTFDLDLTKRVESLANAALAELSWRNVSDYGILVVDRATNEARVMIGGVNYHEGDSGQVNSVLALRQPGSAIKPFTYTLAFQNLGLTPEDTILDLPVGYKTSEDYSYEPKNYSRDYKGEIPLREALSQSINIPAIKLAERVGVLRLLDFLRSVGISSLTENADHYGLALTLGDGEVSLYELLQAYTIFANEGKLCRFKTISPVIARNHSENDDVAILHEESSNVSTRESLTQDRHAALAMTNREESCTQLVDPKYTDMIVSILTDRYAKLGGFPINSPLDFPDRRVFVKTGTSRNFRDNWAVGFTDRYLIGVWSGNKSGENMKGVSGATGAGEIFSRLVYALEPVEQKPEANARKTKSEPYIEITTPLSGSVYSLDPSKSPSAQSIKPEFRTNIEYDQMNWLLDEKMLSGSIVPTIGTHSLEAILIKDGEIKERQRASFRVEVEK